MRLTDILDPDWVKAPLAATDKQSAITELIGVLAAGGALRDCRAALDAVLKREEIRSTAIGQGLALPHGKCDSVDRTVMAFGRLAEAVDFASADGRPVDLVVVLVSPRDNVGPHIQALARISRFLGQQEFRRDLRAAADAAEIHRLLCEQDDAVRAGRS